MLKNLLKQYLDGISLNDDVLKNNNPLFIVNNKVNMTRPPIEKAEKAIIEGNMQVNNTFLQMQGQRVSPFQWWIINNKLLSKLNILFIKLC